MPMLTIGILALAALVLVVAIWIQSLGGDSDSLTPTENLQTAAALKTLEASTQQPTGQSGTPASTGSPAGTPRPTIATTTPGTARTSTAAPGGRTYTVESGDTCGGIAEANGIPLAEFLALNNLDEEKCLSLQVGDVLKLP